MIFVGNIPHPLPPEDLLTTGDRDALASWFTAQADVNYSFQLIEDFLNDRARIPKPASNESAPKTNSKGASPHYAAESSAIVNPGIDRANCLGSRPGGRKTRKSPGTLHPHPDVCGTR